MRAARAGGLLAALVVVASVPSGCKGARAGSPEGGPADAAAVDGGDSGNDAGSVAAVRVPPPPDDSAPPSANEQLTARARHLLEAITNDDSSLATDILFPRDGWLAVRDAVDAGKDWDKRVAGPFRRSVHALAKRQKRADRAKLVSFELGHAVVQASPRKHGWKKPLWTVSGSRLTFLVGGRVRTLSIREMTGWRGAWYVTRLR